MQRRALLAMLGTTAVATAGCLSDTGDRSTDAPQTNSTDDPGTDDPGTDSSGPGDPNGTSTDSGVNEPHDPFEDAPCPSFDENADRTVCWHTADTDAEPIYLDASTVVFEPSTDDNSVETMEFVLHNNSDGTFGLNPYDWQIQRQTDDGWEHVAPDARVEPWLNLEAGLTYTWNLSVERHPTPHQERTQAIMEDLDDGTYAVQITGLTDQESDDPTHVECIALFEVDRKD